MVQSAEPSINGDSVIVTGLFGNQPSLCASISLRSFPISLPGRFDYGILKRARTAGLVEIATHDLRSFTHDRHRTVDDRPFGGGEGMVLKAQPIYDAVQSLQISPKGERERQKETVILLSAQGQPFTSDDGAGAGGDRAGGDSLRAV